MTPKPRIYLDHAATTPILPAAKAAMADALDRWANPSSPHAEGRAARAALEDARERIKRALGWDGELIFTSGATEALAIAMSRAGEKVAISEVEHDAVMRRSGRAEPLDVDSVGLIDLHRLASWKTEEVPDLLVVQHANNETGVMQAIDQVRDYLASLYGRVPTLLTDCAQTAGKLPLPPADLIALSSHKLGGPPGVGALLARNLSLLKATGGQERGYRGGTENLPAIIGLAAALEACEDWMSRAASLRERLESRLAAAGAQVVAGEAPRIPTIGAYRMAGVASETQLIHFDLAGIAVSAGSACSSGSMKVSHVYRAMHWQDAAAREVVRVSFGPRTTEQEVDAFAAAWEQLAERKRAA